MRRRQVMIGMGVALAAPSIVRAQNSRVLRYVAAGYGVVQLDPLATTAYPTLILGLQVFESLYSVDENLTPRPQMAAGHVVEDDGKRWVITLRNGLRFHDGEPVLARDCVASVHRWMKRDLTGRTMAERLDALEAADDRTVVFRPQEAIPPTSVCARQGVAEHDGRHASATGRNQPKRSSPRVGRKWPVSLPAKRILRQQPSGACAVRGV